MASLDEVLTRLSRIETELQKTGPSTIPLRGLVEMIRLELSGEAKEAPPAGPGLLLRTRQLADSIGDSKSHPVSLNAALDELDALIGTHTSSSGSESAGSKSASVQVLPLLRTLVATLREEGASTQTSIIGLIQEALAVLGTPSTAAELKPTIAQRLATVDSKLDGFNLEVSELHAAVKTLNEELQRDRDAFSAHSEILKQYQRNLENLAGGVQREDNEQKRALAEKERKRPGLFPSVLLAVGLLQLALLVLLLIVTSHLRMPDREPAPKPPDGGLRLDRDSGSPEYKELANRPGILYNECAPVLSCPPAPPCICPPRPLQPAGPPGLTPPVPTTLHVTKPGGADVSRALGELCRDQCPSGSSVPPSKKSDIAVPPGSVRSTDSGGNAAQ